MPQKRSKIVTFKEKRRNSKLSNNVEDDVHIELFDNSGTSGESQKYLSLNNRKREQKLHEKELNCNG